MNVCDAGCELVLSSATNWHSALWLHYSDVQRLRVQRIRGEDVDTFWVRKSTIQSVPQHR